jgi:1,4-dihydroxy-2-naphthoate octaprenyltransferase
VCMRANAWNICVCATIIAVWAVGFVTDYWWFLYMLVCTIMVIRKEKKVGQGNLNNRMRTKGEKIHVRIY